ncbi:MAG TPA: hypothetical protein ENK91_07400, partial [Bacteroidetes bacterium]|nr:hypothetical protein [Bacteroidota bacterium]
MLKKKKIIALSITLFYFFILQGQNAIIPYESFEFEGYSPIWKHVVMDSSLIGEYVVRSNDTIVYDGWSNYHITNSEKSVVIQGKDMFLTATLFKEGFEGAFIERLDINNGNVKWQKSVDFRDNDRKEWPFYSYINSQNELEVLGARQLYNEIPKLPDPLWIKAVLFVRKYDMESGDLLDFSFGDETDTLTQITKNYFTNFAGQAIYLKPYDSDKYQFLYQNYVQSPNEKIIDYKNFIIDNAGKKIDNLSLTEDIEYQPFVARITSVGADTILSFVHSYKDETSRSDSFDVNLNVFDKDLNKIKELNFTEDLGPLSRCDLLYADKDNIVLIGTHTEEIDSIAYQGYFYSRFDYKGNLLEKVFLKDENGLPVKQPSKAIVLKYEDAMLIVSKTKLPGGFWGLNFY